MTDKDIICSLLKSTDSLTMYVVSLSAVPGVSNVHAVPVLHKLVKHVIFILLNFFFQQAEIWVV